jgi:hypothetical protein
VKPRSNEYVAEAFVPGFAITVPAEEVGVVAVMPTVADVIAVLVGLVAI